MVTDVDRMLQEYAGEIACYIRARDGLRPLVLRLTTAITEYFQHPGERPQLELALELKHEHAVRRARLGDVYRRWEQTRGASESLRAAVAAMSPAQARRFDLLAAKDRELAEERSEFEEVSKRLRGLLLLFSEMVVE